MEFFLFFAGYEFEQKLGLKMSFLENFLIVFMNNVVLLVDLGCAIGSSTQLLY